VRIETTSRWAIWRFDNPPAAHSRSVRGSGAVMAASAGVRVPSQAAESRWALGGSSVGGAAPVLAGERGGGIGREEQGANLFELDRGSVQFCTVVGGQGGGVHGCSTDATVPAVGLCAALRLVRARPADRRTPGRLSNPGWPTTAIAS
jgi:hypothetical protein